MDEITPNSPWRFQTQISEDMAVQELDKKGAFSTPLFDGIGDPEAATRRMYRYAKSRNWSFEILLGVCGREHSWGTNENSVLWRMNTRSWANAKTVRTPGMGGQRVYDPVRKDWYFQYVSVEDSLADFIYRIDDPTYSYAGLTSIADIVKVIAPKEDSNDPEGYAWWLANYANGLISRMVSPHLGGDNPNVAWIPADIRHYTPGRHVQWPDMWIQHHTDGWDSLAWLSTSPNSNVSATYLFNHDGSARAQLVRHADTPHTTLAYNDRSLSGEWERKWPEQHDIPDSTYNRLGAAIADILRIERERGNPNFIAIDRDQVHDHNDFYNTVCPGNLDVGRLYEIIVQNFEVDPAVPPGMRYFPETGRFLYGGFKGFWEELEQVSEHLVGRTCGPPVTDEGWATIIGYDEQQRVQRFVKGWMIWNKQLGVPYNITKMNNADIDAITEFREERVRP